MSKFTSGKWEVVKTPNDTDFSHEISLNGSLRLAIYRSDYSDNEDIARLIAKAPEMYGLLNDMAEDLETYRTGVTGCSSLRRWLDLKDEIDKGGNNE